MVQQEVVTEYRKYFPQAVFLGGARDPYEAYLAGRAIHHTNPLELAAWVEKQRIPERVEFATGNPYAQLPVFRVQIGGRVEGEHQTKVPVLHDQLMGAFA
jgi:hypothetical protein